jgi:hypothetical protein
MYKLSEVEDVKIGGKFIRPGINENVVIAGFTGVTPTSGSPRLEIEFRLATSGEEDKTKVNFYMSEGAAKKSLSKIKHLATKVVTEDAFNAVEATDLEDLANKLNKLLKGKTVAEMKFIGEEYKNSNGELKVKATIGLPEFASANKGALKYDATSKWDFKKLEPSDDDATPVADGVNNSGLPF